VKKELVFFLDRREGPLRHHWQGKGQGKKRGMSSLGGGGSFFYQVVKKKHQKSLSKRLRGETSSFEKELGETFFP